MEMPSASIIISVVNTLIVALIAGDRWVHSISGPAPLSARVDGVESNLKKILDEASSRNTQYTGKIGMLEVDLAVVKTDIKNMKDVDATLDRRITETYVAFDRRHSS